MVAYQLSAPLSNKTISNLHIGDEVSLSGTLFMARDAAHARMIELLEKGEDLPINLKNQIILYAGPCPARPGEVSGPVAATSAYRMDPYAPILFKYGVKATIGKGPRGDIIKESCKKYGTISFAAVGGLAALLSKCITKEEIVAYEDLGPEAIRRIEVKDFPLWVAYDIHGRDIYSREINKYQSFNPTRRENV